ncbi:hypothetical protein C8R43DRAFT_995153 [Mycena crocata]|nr:hypothetical protein C8R43DRAFT_995153 [Mycena crocata]
MYERLSSDDKRHAAVRYLDRTSMDRFGFPRRECALRRARSGVLRRPGTAAFYPHLGGFNSACLLTRSRAQLSTLTSRSSWRVGLRDTKVLRWTKLGRNCIAVRRMCFTFCQLTLILSGGPSIITKEEANNPSNWTQPLVFNGQETCSEHGDSIESHLGHCIDILRHMVQCSVDTTPLPDRPFLDGSVHVNYQADTLHVCRDLNKVKDWTSSRSGGADFRKTFLP